MLGLLGPNRAGKSTLMRFLATVTRPTTGRALWNGIDLACEPDALRRVLGYLPQDFGVYPNLTAWEFLEYPASGARCQGGLGNVVYFFLWIYDMSAAAARPSGAMS